MIATVAVDGLTSVTGLVRVAHVILSGVLVVIEVALATTNCVAFVTLEIVVATPAEEFETDIPATNPAVLETVIVVPETTVGVTGEFARVGSPDETKSIRLFDVAVSAPMIETEPV
jgi:hypothetical protein